jgi:hypothetical protein
VAAEEVIVAGLNRKLGATFSRIKNIYAIDTDIDADNDCSICYVLDTHYIIFRIN